MGILFPVIQVSLSRPFFVKNELVSGAATPFDFGHRLPWGALSTYKLLRSETTFAVSERLEIDV
jgi:hypothetical protein